MEEIVAFVRREARPGDVVILMSSGAFGGLPETLLESLG
jgi:UDP-N-acetylmuramate-alanine ligase